jgi:5-(carboxyamino)imidazole ribonucleotide mutase
VTNTSVLVLYGSPSDAEVMAETGRVLAQYGIAYEEHAASAHRTPEKVRALVSGAEVRGVRVIVAAAGMAAHLAGTVAALTPLPVIGVPLGGGPLGGIDALLSTVQMPAGVPVGTVAIGAHGAKNAGHLAARIIALADPAVARTVADQRQSMAEGRR